MVYDEGLAQRIRELIIDTEGVEEKKMFGGVGFILQGNMACGVNREDLIIRVGPDHYQEALSEPNVKVFDLTGRAMTGWIAVQAPGYQLVSDLRKWVDRGLTFARTLPPK
jgi:TfoX/Sxy family transcriptional regulator of competence genes